MKRLSEIDAILEEGEATLAKMGAIPNAPSIPPETQNLQETVLAYTCKIAPETHPRIAPM